MRRVLAAIGVGLALAAAGCGGDDEDEPAAGQEAPAAQATPEEPTGGTDAADAGEQRFASTCGGCHTLAAAGTSGQVGPNLDELQPDEDRVLDAIASGPGAMPENLLEGPDAAQVAQYVAENAGQ